MLRNLAGAQLESLANHLQMRRYEDGTRVLDHDSGVGAPLRILAHGHASWEPLLGREKRGACMMTTGSVFGLASVNEWARRKQLPDAWPVAAYPEIRCRAVGPIWTLELSPQHFDQAFGSQGGPLAARLLRSFPVTLHAAAIVAALREIPQFSRVSSNTLYRMLEYARMASFAPLGEPGDNKKVVQLDVDQLGADQLEHSPDSGKRQRRLVGHDRALYYVLDGTLRIETDSEFIYLGPGALGGPDVFHHGAAKLALPTATVKTHAIVIDGRVLFEMVRCDPGFGRALGPHVNTLEASK